MSDIVPFNYEGKEVRTIVDNLGETLWVAKDVAEVLGYKDTANAIKTHCRGVAKHHPLPTPGGVQTMRVIHEPDLYRMIAHSQLKGAERFERWIFEQVLPTIRQTGRYETLNSSPVSIVHVTREFRAALSLAKACGLKGNQALLAANKVTSQITDVAPLALLEISLPSETQIPHKTPSELGKILGGLSGIIVNKLLLAAGLQTRGEDGAWRPTTSGQNYSVLLDTGKRRGNGTPVQQIKWLETVVHLIGAAQPQPDFASNK